MFPCVRQNVYLEFVYRLIQQVFRKVQLAYTNLDRDFENADRTQEQILVLYQCLGGDIEGISWCLNED